MTTYDILVPLIALSLAGAASAVVYLADEPVEQAKDAVEAVRRRLRRSIVRAMWAQAVVIVAAIVALVRILGSSLRPRTPSCSSPTRPGRPGSTT